ncbi:MAG: hypothetical protein V1859_04300 [archaeon]
MELIKITPDKNRAKSLVELAEIRKGKLNSFDIEKESALLLESYYEICKELITALLFIDGYKTLSHKDLVDYISRNDEFTESEIHLIDSLRIKRNELVYYGIFVQKEYLIRNKEKIENIIMRLFSTVKNRL